MVAVSAVSTGFLAEVDATDKQLVVEPLHFGAWGLTDYEVAVLITKVPHTQLFHEHWRRMPGCAMSMGPLVRTVLKK